MAVSVALDSLDLAALLCSRVCHDLISPAGAIVNGLEVLEDKESDQETRDFALDLIKKSARTASARLQFCRLAFGAAGSAGAQIDLGDAEQVARGALDDGKTKLVWSLPRVYMAKNRVKLLLNMLVVAGHAIPRGGQLSVEPVGEGEAMGFRIQAAGPAARVPAALLPLLEGACEGGLVDSHAIQPFYTGMLARSCGLGVQISADGETIVIATRAAADAREAA